MGKSQMSPSTDHHACPHTRVACGRGEGGGYAALKDESTTCRADAPALEVMHAGTRGSRRAVRAQRPL